MASKRSVVNRLGAASGAKAWRTAILAIALSLSLTAQKIPTGPGTGSAIPTFQAPDQNGRTQSLRTITGPKGALLVFYRSADW